MRALYSFGISLYTFAIRLASPFNAKAKKWLKGRKNWRQKFKLQTIRGDSWIWFHCSSLGEFEQGRPVLESIRKQYPRQKILLTFFSPSGYEIQKNYSLADFVCYLPADSPKNAIAFLEIFQPQAAFFIKTDIWINYILELKNRNTPAFLVSALLQKESKFLNSRIAPLYKKAFESFAHVFVQDEPTYDIFDKWIGGKNISVVGDTRFDRAAKLPETFNEVPHLSDFVGDDFCVIAGSPWLPDEEIILHAISVLKDLPIKWVIAPHEIDPGSIQKQMARFSEKSIRYSEIEKLNAKHSILWIDNVGMLNRLYHYADLTYIGGGFGKGIHNTQEPAAYGKPVAFGPYHQRYREAVEMVEMETAFVINTPEDFVKYVTDFYKDRKKLAEVSQKNQKYMQSQAGATEKVMEAIGEILKLD